MEELDNPAARFYSLIKEGQKKGKDEQCVKIWREMLSVPEEDNALLLRRIGFVWELPSLIEEEIKELSHINHDVYLKWLPRVNSSIRIMNFQNPWKTFIDRFDSEILYGLEICADALHRSRPQKSLSEATLKDLVDKVNSLLESIPSGEFPGSVERFIVTRLEEILFAISEYPYRGVAPLEYLIENSVGKVVASPELYQESRDSHFGKKFWEFMGYLAVTVTITTGAIQIGKEVVSLLPEIEGPAKMEAEIVRPQPNRDGGMGDDATDKVVET